MIASSTKATAPDVPFAPTPLSASQLQPLEGLQHDEEGVNPHSKFQAHGVYRPPHMRNPSESTASVIGSDHVAHDTATVHSAHGSSLDREGEGTSRPPTPRTGFAPGFASFGYGEVKKKIHEELLSVRKAVEEMETIEKEFLEEEARFERHIQVLRSRGLTDEEIRAIVDWDPAIFLSRPPTVEPLDVNNVTTDLVRVNLGSEQEATRPTRKGATQRTEEELTNKTPIPGGPIYSSRNHPGGIHQTGKYGYTGPFTTPANNAHQNLVMYQSAGWNEQVHTQPEATGRHESIPAGTIQAPGQICQATPGMRLNSSVNSLPPRFRKLAYNQHAQNAASNRPKDTVPVGNPVSWPPILTQPQNSIPNHTFRTAIQPPPPRPYFYQLDLIFDFEGIALSSGCNRDVFVKTYWKRNGSPPSQAAWAAWASAVEKVKRAWQHEHRNAMEREARERYGTGSRLPRWSSSFLEDLPDSNLGHSSSSSDASTKVASSRTSETGDEGNIVASLAGPYGEPGIEVSCVQKRWKDVADKTWAFGEPPRPDDPEQYMTHIAEEMGWQTHDPRLERLFLDE